MAEHTKGARPSTHNKHTDRQKQDKQVKKQIDKGWVHQGKNTNNGNNKNQKNSR
jgi:hypothetical protein